MPRFFVNADQIRDNEIEIIGQDVNHIKNVLRLSNHAKITICDGQAVDYKCSISEIGDRTIRAQILSKGPSRSEAETKITLFQSLIKGDKFEWVIQKSIEIGVSQIVPIQTAHCVSKLDGAKKTKSRIKRWNKIAQAAAKQSGRGMIPEVTEPLSYKQALNQAQAMDLAFVAYVKEEVETLKSHVEGFKGKTIGIFIGPEGGFSDAEIQKAEECHVKPITLGPRILRSETASLVLLSNILYELGEMDL